MEITLEDNISLVHYVLLKFNIAKDQYDDLFQEGIIGLIKAIQTFDISKNNKFSTYAYICIRNEIIRYINRDKCFQVSLDDILYDNVSILECIDNGEPNILCSLIKKEEHEKIYKIIQTKLTELERNVLVMSYGINCTKQKQKEIQNKLGLKQYQVSRIKKKALKVIREQLIE